MTKITKKLPKPSQLIDLSREYFLTFWLISYLWKYWAKKPKKTLFWPKFNFLVYNDKIFKNKKFNKKREKTFLRHMYLDGFHKFLAILVKNIFLPLFKHFWTKINFWRFLKNVAFNQKSDYLNRFLAKIPFRKCILLYLLD